MHGDRADLATPRATVTLLRAMAARPEFSLFDAALPILGRDGTLAKAVASNSRSDPRVVRTSGDVSRALTRTVQTCGVRSPDWLNAPTAGSTNNNGN